MEPIIDSTVIDYLIEDLVETPLGYRKHRLTPKEAIAVSSFDRLKRKSLDVKLTIAHKLNKRFFIVLVDADKGINIHEFATLFKESFTDVASNKHVAEILMQNGLLVFGDNELARYLNRIELFLSSDLYNVMRTVRKLRGKNVDITTAPNVDKEQRELYIHVVLKSFILYRKMLPLLTSLSLNFNEFMAIALLYIHSYPMTRLSLHEKMRNIGLGKNQFVPLRTLKEKGYAVNSVDANQHKTWTLTVAGHDVIRAFIKAAGNEL